MMETESSMSFKMALPVVAGVFIDNGRVLVGKRARGDSMSGFWEFPGGKIEPKEQPQESLNREVLEEIGVHVVESKLFHVQIFDYKNFTRVLILFYKVLKWRGQPKNLYHQELLWLPFEKLSSYQLLEGNKEVVYKLIQDNN